MERLPPYLFGKINDAKYARRQAGIDIIDLGMGNPSDPAPAEVVRKLAEAAGDPRNQRYSMAKGIPNLRREVAKNYQAKWGVELDPDSEVLQTIGSKEGFSHLCLALLGPGDTALVPIPAFPIHIHAVVIAGANVIGVCMTGTSEEELVGRLAEAARNTRPRPKVLILNYPHNPTTRVVSADFYAEIVKIARKLDMLILSDFAYGETVFDDYVAPSILQAPGARKVAAEFSTMSKAYNMAGFRVGFLCGNAEICQALASIKGYYDYGHFQPIQIATIIALRHCQATVREQALVYQGRRDALLAGLAKGDWHVEPPKATMFVWAPMPERYRTMGSMKFCMWLMDEADVAMAPGIGFGEEGEGFVRIALVENEKRLQQAARQIRRAFRRRDREEAE